MAGTAVSVDAARCLGIGLIAVAGIGLVLVIVMAEVLGGTPRFMLAVDANCRPAELKRQEDEQQNREPTTHAQNCSS